EGDPIAVIRDSQRLAWWKRAQTWVAETRGKSGQWSESLVTAVQDLGHAQGRIGVVGLQDVLRDPEGTVSYTEWARILAALPEPNQTYLMPTFRKLDPNDIIFTEFDAKYGGYMAQGDETVCVGTPPEEYERLFEVSLECFHLAMETIKPGVPWDEVIRVVQDR